MLPNLLKPNKRSLNDWLTYIESLHPEEMELGLDRIGVVYQRLQLATDDVTVVTIAGTNGKGSTVAYLESILLASGYQVGCYTSPHLVRYNERIRLNGQPVSDPVICKAFEQIEAARGDIQLTYFEFGTLAAFIIFFHQSLSIALLEVGLGGRLDAVNIIDSDIAVITAIDLDHTDWLGETREQIGREKAGIFRSDRPAICSDPKPPKSIVAAARDTGASLYCIDEAFSYQCHNNSWDWRGFDQVLDNLPLPKLVGLHQLQNASAALAVISLLGDRFTIQKSAICQGLTQPMLAGRIEEISSRPSLIVDVSHNPQSISALAKYVAHHPVPGATVAVLGMLKDKDLAAGLQSILPLIDRWYLADLTGARGAAASSLVAALIRLGVTSPTRCFASAAEALAAAQQDVSADDRILVFGSFQTVGAIMPQLQQR